MNRRNILLYTLAGIFAILGALANGISPFIVGIPAAEVHISDPDKREDFRKVNFLRPACVITVSGKGIFGYGEAMGKLAEFIEKRKTEK